MNAVPNADPNADPDPSGAAPRPDPVRPADDEARATARRLLGAARHGALATLEPGTGHPLASRAAVALDADGAPLLLLSALSAHFGALGTDPRCSLLVGEPGAGDPLAHPRLTVAGHARRLDRSDPDAARVRARWLAAHPKAALYVDFADFSFWRLEPERGSLNGGFGRAYRLGREDLLAARAPAPDG
ncbi:MAG TPA: pyridoxamine 5'-phosphate oxidase family protein [Burkholderiaceae bacterium]|nr:pyridoxamine 5'-phosphate oxidase family protein [Burkholderiaceae bacterium]